MAKVTIRKTGSLELVAKSAALGDQLQRISEPAWDYLNRDPNPFFRATLRRQRFVSRGKRGRVSIQMGAHPVIGMRVQAKRGTFSRALASAGL